MTHAIAALWDMDGVLVDSGRFHYLAWCETLPQFGIPFDEEQFRATFGMNNAGVLEAVLGRAPLPDLLAAISDRKEKSFRRAVRGRAEALPGVLDWLKHNRTAGAVQAVASSAPWENIEALLGELDLWPHFEAVVSGVGLPGKPEPAVFQRAATRLGVLPQHCVVVEDAVAGVEAARRAGMKVIAVTTTNAADRLRDADIVVDRLDLLGEDAFARLWDGCETL